MTLATVLTAAEAIAGPLLSTLTQLVPLAGTGEIASIISTLEQVIPLAISEATSLVQPIQNIVTQLQSGAAVTADQLTTLAAMNVQLDAAFNAAASADGV